MDIYKAAIRHWGQSRQKLKAQEELIELVKEIQNDLAGKLDKAQMLTEIADVCNMIVQLADMYEFSEDEIVNEMVRKMERTRERIQEDM